MSREMKQLLISLDNRLRQLTDLVAKTQAEDVHAHDRTAGKTRFLDKDALQKGLFRITQGEAMVVRGDPNQAPPLAALGPSDFYGRVPFLRIGHEPDGASVLVSKKLRATQVDSDRLLEEYDGLSAMFKAMISHVGNALSFLTERVEHHRAKGD